MKKKTIFFVATGIFVFAVVLAVILLICGNTVNLEKGTKLSQGEVTLSAPVIVADTDGEFDSVLRAAKDLQQDFSAVTGKAPTLQKKVDASNTNIIVGTIGKSNLIDALVKNGTLDVTTIKDKWEGYQIGVYTGINGNEKTIVIAGSDMRGTIYGIYALSEAIGVSPWYWWADVPIEEQKTLSLPVETLTQEEFPDVKYRGIFINDEEASAVWGKLYENDTDSQGSPNPYIYGKMFELLLRLKANTLWPAMHATSDAFNAIVNPETGVAYNAELAGEYGIVMGSSHCEMLLCNNETEWVPWCEANVGKYNLKKINNDWKASYDYTVNAEAMNAYWEDRVAANYQYENIYTLGLRGVHDSEILCSALADKSWAGKASVVRQAVEAQVAILEKYEDIYEKETGERREFATCFCPYKEAAEYYKHDLSLPEDCIILFADDNYGYVRQYPNNHELETYAGCGVYYHVSYRGVPRSYLWIDSAPLSLIYEEMHKSYMAGSDDMWILNVGDLKPAEFSTNFFLDLAWDEDSISGDNLEGWMQAFFLKNFALSPEDADSLAELHSEFLQIASAYRADFQGYKEGTEYNIYALGDEAQQVINRMEEIVQQATAIYETLPAQRKDSYFEVVLYRMRATLFTLQKNVYMQKNALSIAQGRFASVNAYATLAEAAYKNILTDLNTYNSLQNGKWRYMMDPYITDNGSPIITGAPKVTYLSSGEAKNGVGAAAEGQRNKDAVTLSFDSLENTTRFLDVFGTGLKTASFQITTAPTVLIHNADGTLLPHQDENGVRTYTGAVDVETRYFVTVDWSLMEDGESTLSLTVSDDYGYSITYPLSLYKQIVDPQAEQEAGKQGYYEVNGIISIEAEHFSQNVAVGEKKWEIVKHLGISGHSMKAYPDTSATAIRIDDDYETTSPYLEYHFYVVNPGTFSGTFYRIPTLNEGDTDDGVRKTCRIGWSLDGGTVDFFRGNSAVDTNGASNWSDGVRYNYDAKTFTLIVKEAGWHTLRVYMADAGCAFDKIVLRNQNVKEVSSRLGYSETFNTISYEATKPATAPDFSFEQITWKDQNGTLLFDFTNKVSNVQNGYIGVDPNTEYSDARGYGWTEGATLLHAEKSSASGVSLRDGGVICGEGTATFVVRIEQPGTYMVAVSVGDRRATGVDVSNMTVSVAGTTMLSNMSQAKGGTCEYAFVVTVTDSELPITFAGTWAVSSVEIRPYTEYKARQGPVSAGTDGNVVIEAEWALENNTHFSAEASKDGKNYHFMPTGGTFGGAVYFGPNTGNSYPSTDMNNTQSAKLSYAVQLKKGTYSVIAYVKCEEDNDDSIIMALDGAQVQSANDFKLTGGEYKAFRIGNVVVEEDGMHILSIFGREDGLAIDRLVVTTDLFWD